MYRFEAVVDSLGRSGKQGATRRIQMKKEIEDGKVL